MLSEGGASRLVLLGRFADAGGPDRGAAALDEPVVPRNAIGFLLICAQKKTHEMEHKKKEKARQGIRCK